MIDKEFQVCKACGGTIKIENSRYNLVKCVECGFVFCKLIFSEEEFTATYKKLYSGDLKEAYSRHSVHEYEELQKGRIIIGHNRSRILSKYMQKYGQVLEIGSGVGLIGSYLKRFPKIAFTGIELDTATHEKALKLGLNSINGDFSIMANLPNSYDTILMWEVLEHLQDLDLFLKLANEKLNVGGSIILSVPNYDKRLNYKDQSDQIYQDAPPVHLNFFTIKTINDTFKSRNFEVRLCATKKIPYFKLGDKMFYINAFKALFGKYHGSTIYFAAVKK